MRPTVLLVLALALPIGAQAQLLQPAPENSGLLRIGLRPLSPPQAETGICALAAVPEFAAMLQALARRSRDAMVQLSAMARIVEPTGLPLPLAQLLDAPMQAITLASRYPWSSRRVAMLVDFAPERAALAGGLFEAALAQCKRAGGAFEQDAPWRDGRRLAVNTDWLAVRGRQFLAGRREPTLQLQEGAAADIGFQLHMRVPSSMTESNAALFAGLNAALGFPSPPQEAADVTVDAQGCRERFALVGPRGAAPAARPLSAAPLLPRLDGQFLSMRANLDPQIVLGILEAYVGRFLPDVDAVQLRRWGQRCVGGFALGVSAPPLGSLYPRIALAASVSDGDALMAELQQRAEAAPSGALQLKAVDGVPTAMLKLPGVPAALRPSLCVVDGVLLLCECPATLRAVRKAMGQGDDVFADASTTACGPPDGATVLGEVWFDCDTIYRRVAKVWGSSLLALALTPDVGDPLWQVEDIVDPRDLPDAGDVARTLGRGRAVLYAGADEVGMVVAAPALGPLLSGALAVGTPLLPKVAAMAIETQVRQARVQAAVARARRLGLALQRYRKLHEDALPGEVGELVALLPPGDDEPLLAPHDQAPLPRSATLADGSRKQQSSSFQLAPVGMMVPPARSVFAFCGAGYRGHHMVILADGEVTWIRSEGLLDAVLHKR